jgi:hypothetical protein
MILVRIGEEEPLHEFAFLGLAGDEGFLLQGFFADIEAQLGLAVARVVAVAVEAVVRKDRPDVAVEFDGLEGRGPAARPGRGRTGRGGRSWGFPRPPNDPLPAGCKEGKVRRGSDSSHPVQVSAIRSRVRVFGDSYRFRPV